MYDRTPDHACSSEEVSSYIVIEPKQFACSDNLQQTSSFVATEGCYDAFGSR